MNFCLRSNYGYYSVLRKKKMSLKRKRGVEDLPLTKKQKLEMWYMCFIVQDEFGAPWFSVHEQTEQEKRYFKILEECNTNKDVDFLFNWTQDNVDGAQEVAERTYIKYGSAEVFFSELEKKCTPVMLYLIEKYKAEATREKVGNFFDQFMRDGKDPFFDMEDVEKWGNSALTEMFHDIK